mmetsp:Transcript_46510/g.97730  ORF Transcript_46510/g.97730 Transcript_46510/m.97730 type:complete len:220 (-) Transcript_46510:785-1444(-)
MILSTIFFEVSNSGSILTTAEPRLSVKELVVNIIPRSFTTSHAMQCVTRVCGSSIVGILQEGHSLPSTMLQPSMIRFAIFLLITSCISPSICIGPVFPFWEVGPHMTQRFKPLTTRPFELENRGRSHRGQQPSEISHPSATSVAIRSFASLRLAGRAVALTLVSFASSSMGSEALANILLKLGKNELPMLQLIEGLTWGVAGAVDSFEISPVVTMTGLA